MNNQFAQVASTMTDHVGHAQLSSSMEGIQAACHFVKSQQQVQNFAPSSCQGVDSPCDATHLNNMAVSFLQIQSQNEALEMLHQAWIRHGFAAYQQQPLEEQLFALSCMSALSASIPVLMHPSMLVLECHQPTICSVPVDGAVGTFSVNVPEDQDLTASPGNFFSVYNRAFVFKEKKATTFDWFRRQKLLPAVILYNIALTHHKRALNKVNADEYVAALKFYKMSLGIVEDNLNSGYFSSDYCLLKLALYNNMGYLSSHFFNENDTILFGGRMLATFASIDCTQLLSKEEYVFFYMNLLFLLNRHPLCAPAA